MNVLVVDTSVWIEFFRGKTFSDLELALQEARVILSPLVLAELVTGTRSKFEIKKLTEFLKELKIHETKFDHWVSTGKLRSHLSRRGLNISIPDAHIAQCAIDVDGYLMSLDKVFKKISKFSPLRLLA